MNLRKALGAALVNLPLMVAVRGTARHLRTAVSKSVSPVLALAAKENFVPPKSAETYGSSALTTGATEPLL